MVDVKYLESSIKRFVKFDEPWEYFLVDDFFDKDTATRLVESESCRCFYSELSTLTDLEREIFLALDNTVIRDAFDDLVHVRPDATPVFSTATHPNKYEYRVHVDMYNKTTSLVLYLGDSSPCDGTTIYNANQEYSHTVEFKHNRALLFRTVPGSYHAYGPFVSRSRTSFVANYWIRD